MAEKRKLQLHLGKCIEDLDKLHNVPDLKAKRTTVLCKTAQKLFDKAEESWVAGDEEYAYVYYMKYLRVVAFLSKEKDYLKDKTYYTSMLGPKNPTRAIDMAEKLKNSLIERYDTERQQPPRASRFAAEPMLPAEPPPTAPSPLDHDLPGLEEVTIHSEQLFPLLKSNKMRVMILDTRPRRHFDESHLNHPACISVPEEVITPGQSANVLEQKLPPASRQVWSERASAALVVMMDWSSTTVIPGKPLFLLKTILLKWDVKVHYARAPLCLWGGYEDWLLKYPAMTTNPRVQLPEQQQHISDILGSIEYPSWEEATVTPPETAPLPPRPKGSEPVVDRSSKAAAVQKYEERAQQMQAILEQQEYIADTSLSLELRRIEAEQDWERIRVQSESENRVDLRAVYKLREQEIISQLMQLENKQFDMEQENQSLREQLEEYQRREREEAERSAGETASKQQPSPPDSQHLRFVEEVAAREMANKAARIAAMTSKRAALDQQREELETQRKRKLAEARRTRKPAIYTNKDEDGETFLWPGDEEGSEGASGLTRSQSSSTIAQQPEEGEPAPTFDRSAKPQPRSQRDQQRERTRQAERERNFEGIPADDDAGRGLTGLRNLGNTCYMNSIIQCLNNTAMLVSYFCNGQYMDHIDRSTATRGEVAEELAALVRALWSGQYKHIGAKDLRLALGKQQRAFRDTRQQDSHEFLTILMDYLHHDLRVTVESPPKETLCPPERAWLEWTKAKESLILKLFYGQIKSTVRCTVCSRASVTYETFSNLSLEMPSHGNRCSLHDCLKLYLTGEMIHGWNCPWCKKKRDAVKKLDIARLPPVLVIHFKRFFMNHSVADVPKCEKKMTYIDFPLSKLEMRPYVLPQPATTEYDLYAVSNHYGSTTSGHYTALCKSSVHDKWYLYDDHAVSEVSERDVKSSAAYILFYTSCRGA